MCRVGDEPFGFQWRQKPPVTSATRGDDACIGGAPIIFIKSSC